MYQHHQSINQRADLEIKKKASSSHLTLIQDLETALMELSSATAISTPDPDSQVVSHQKKISTKKATKNHEEWFIGIRIAGQSFFLSSKKDMPSTYHFKIFLKQVEQASLLSKYNSKQSILKIENSISDNIPKTLATLYHVVQRNKYCFNERYGISQKLQASINSTLTILNQKYCAHLEQETNSSAHHLDLINLVVSSHNPPAPILKEVCISYISIYYEPNNPSIIRIKKTSLTSPIKASYTTTHIWLKSLSKHYKRILLTLQNLQTMTLYLQCNDNSWPLYHQKDTSIDPTILLKTLISISKYNYTSFSAYFKEPLDTGKEIFHRGYKKNEEILSSILQTLEQAQKDLFLNKASTENTIFQSQVIEKVLPHSMSLPQSSFFSMTKPDNGYLIKMSLILSSRRYETLKFIFSHTKKICCYIKTILKHKNLPKIKYKDRKIASWSLLLSLFYWGIDFNKRLLTHTYHKSYTKDKHQSEDYYLTSSASLTKLQDQLLEELQIALPNEPLPTLSSINHPIAQELLSWGKTIPCTEKGCNSNKFN